jgi:hypothetical protein
VTALYAAAMQELGVRHEGRPAVFDFLTQELADAGL